MTASNRAHPWLRVVFLALLSSAGCTGPDAPGPTCDADNGGCGPHAACAVVDDAVQCACLDGYEAAEGGNTTCVDVDECSVDSDNCAAEASCHNVEGSYLCLCPEGYLDVHGDGTQCDNIDECTLGTDDCIDGSTCHDTPGAFECTCEVDCDPVALCDQSGATATCVCPAGYRDVLGDGSQCDDLDECAVGMTGCASEADCTNTPGSFECACPSGFDDVYGDASVCENIDECTLGTHDCPADLPCIDTHGGYVCGCPPGELDVGGGGEVWCTCPVGGAGDAQVLSSPDRYVLSTFAFALAADDHRLLVGDPGAGGVFTVNPDYDASVCGQTAFGDYNISCTPGDPTWSCCDELDAFYGYVIPECCRGDTTLGTGVGYLYQRHATSGLLELEAELTPSNGGSMFGSSVALGPDLAVAAKPYGPVYVYERDGTGSWNEVAALTVPGRVDAVATDGETVMVGSNNEVRFHHRDGAGAWVLVQAPLARPSWASSSQSYATHLDVDGDLAVATPGPSGALPGAVVTYRRDATTGRWAADADGLVAADNSVSFGSSVALSGGVLVVGDACEVHVFDDGGATQGWGAATSSPLQTYCGETYPPTTRVAVDHGRIVASTDPDGHNDSYAYVFDRQPDGSWIQVQAYLGTDETHVAPAEDSRYGGAVAVGSGIVAVSATSLEEVYDYAQCP